MKTLAKVVFASLLLIVFTTLPCISADKPDWKPKMGLENNMVVYGKVNIKGDIISDNKSIIGAFGPGGESDCRGIARLKDQGAGYNYYLTIGSGKGNDEISFKVYDARNGKIRSVIESLNFESDKNIADKILNAYWF